MRRALTGLRTAVGMLTIVPMGTFEPDASAAVAWYPWVGWAFGALAVGVASFASPFVNGTLGSLLVGVGVVGVWAACSWMLHWDGLADSADGLAGGRTPEERLEIMTDPRTGAFGAFAIALVLAVQVVCAAIVFAGRDWTTLALAPVLGRLSASFMTTAFQPAREGGLGASSRGSGPALTFAALALAPAVAQLFLHQAGLLDRALLLGLCLLLTAEVPWSLTRLIKGYTGDTLGASVVLVEAAVLSVGAVYALVSSPVL